jgi:hypothetical protein
MVTPSSKDTSTHGSCLSLDSPIETKCSVSLVWVQIPIEGEQKELTAQKSNYITWVTFSDI